MSHVAESAKMDVVELLLTIQYLRLDLHYLYSSDL